VILDILWVVGITDVVVLLWRIARILTVAVGNQIEQTSNLLLEMERIRLQMFLLRKHKPAQERGWEEFDKEIRLLAGNIPLQGFTIKR
jgi:hypothetical protein